MNTPFSWDQRLRGDLGMGSETMMLEDSLMFFLLGNGTMSTLCLGLLWSELVRDLSLEVQNVFWNCFLEYLVGFERLSLKRSHL